MAKPVAMKLKKATPRVEELPFDIETDKVVHEGVFQGKKVNVNSDSEILERSDSDEACPRMGKYDPSTKVLRARRYWVIRWCGRNLWSKQHRRRSVGWCDSPVGFSWSLINFCW